MLHVLIPSAGACHHCVILTCPLKAEAVLHEHSNCHDLQREDKEEEEWWGGAGRIGVRVKKKPELPDLNKVNFPAIWPVFRREGEAFEACATRVRMLLFKCLVSQVQQTSGGEINTTSLQVVSIGLKDLSNHKYINYSQFNLTVDL